MTEHYPRIRHHAPGPDGERLLIRESVRIAFYLPHDHVDMAPGVSRALESYMRTVGEGPETICHWASSSGEYVPLDADAWERIRYLLRPERPCRFADDFDDKEALDRVVKRGFETCFALSGDPLKPTRHRFAYNARVPWRERPEGSVSLLHVTLPTEYLEAHGPGRVRELAVQLASHLPFSTGHAGLAFEFLRTVSPHMHRIRDEVFRYPALDVPHARREFLGTQVAGVHWLNFLGPPVLGAVGGAEGLRSRLHSPQTTVQELQGERVAVTLGEWPEAGDLAHGRDLPAYRELARVLEPWLEPFHPIRAFSWRGYTEEEVRRWWRRFLD